MAQDAVPAATLEAEVASLPLPRLLPNLVSDRASMEPNKIWGSIPISSQTTGAGYEDISYRRFNCAIDRAAWWMHNVIGPSRLRPFEPLAYLRPPDSRYIVFTLASIKAGFQMLFISPRNSDEAQYAVMKEADCHKWLCATEIKAKVEALVENRPPRTLNTNSGRSESWNDMLTVVPGQTELLKDELTPPFSYKKTLKEARWEPLVMLHTSSTTGLPKLIPLTQGYRFHEDVVQHYPKEDELDVLTRKPFDGDCRLFLAMPLFHAGGVLLGLLKSLYHDIVMVFQPPAVPLSASVVDGVLRHGKCDGTVIPPFLVEEMLGFPEYFDTLSSLKLVQFGSGPLSKYCGDTLLTRQKSCPHFIRKIDVNVPGIQPVFELFPQLTEWPTRDIYTQYPHKPYLWRTCGRADDVIVLSNGEKLNPVDIESQIAKAHPAITGALVVGQGRFQPALIVEVGGIDVDKEKEKGDLLQAIWSTINAANKTSPKHGQLTKPLILFSSPKKPFLRTPNLSQIAEITSKIIYNNPTIDSLSQALNEIVQAHIADQTTAPQKDRNGNETDNRENRIQEMIDRWTHGWDYQPAILGNSLERQTSPNTTSEANSVVGKKSWTVILTGSTGSLGSHILGVFNFFGQQTWGHLAWVSRKTLNFNLSVSSFEKNHIASIRRFTDFSSSFSKGAHIVFVSSLSLVTSGGLEQSVPEKIIQDNSMPSHMGYGESKYIAERVLNAATASSRGRIPTTSLRVGQIAGPVPNMDIAGNQVKLEVWNAQEWFPSLIISSNTVQALPATLGRMEDIDWIPVNVLANIVIELLQFDNEEIERQRYSEGGDSHLTSRVYHLINRAVVTWQQDILPVVQHFLAIDKVVPLAEWIELLGSSTESDGDIDTAAKPAAKILPFYRSLLLRRDETLAARPKYLTEQTQKASRTLREAGPVRAEWVNRWLSDWDLNPKVKIG
ncbi:uncharacterized protein A1O5_07208 [Cladophialophora psammophila CBS 110553]|uniref:AMP-dependent synthetase/ligase domain-containing protein n=1 Tax=Cladophialophora psammophila CBS 110553 TaxID=1182543 RepID=W9WYJ4_9EURO|nr:uncharacterized protein A1O5_07208 [Cladophialophora psammophila CBS 110553]EXJ70135.1 hypothetical protein A1O5_07208 [Cladophialophora psammophila CBS 110553]